MGSSVYMCGAEREYFGNCCCFRCHRRINDKPTKQDFKTYKRYGTCCGYWVFGARRIPLLSLSTLRKALKSYNLPDDILLVICDYAKIEDEI